MKKLSLFIIGTFLCGYSYAAGPRFHHKDTLIDQEFDNAYNDIRGVGSKLSLFTYFSTSTFLCIDNPTFCVDSTNNNILLADGSVNFPAYGFTFQAGVGLWRSASNQISFGTNSTERWRMGSTGNLSAINGSIFLGADGTLGAPGISFVNEAATGLYRVGTNDAALSAGGTRIIEFTSTGGKIKGTTTNDNATAGDYGEYYSTAATSVNAPATDSYGVIVSTTLTAGDWDLTGLLLISRNSASFTANYGECFISANSGAGTADRTYGVNDMDYNLAGLTTFVELPLIVPSYRVSISVSTTYYLKTVIGTYSAATPRVTARLSARRIR